MKRRTFIQSLLALLGMSVLPTLPKEPENVFDSELQKYAKYLPESGWVDNLVVFDGPVVNGDIEWRLVEDFRGWRHIVKVEDGLTIEYDWKDV